MNNVVGNPEDNSPGVYKINYIPKVQVISIPDAANGILTEPILLQPDALWHEIHVTVDANNLDIDNSNVAEGSVCNIKASGFVAGDAPWLVTVLQEMADYKEFLIICTDGNGDQRLIGSLEHPALFEYKLTYNGRRGYTLLFNCISDTAPYYYTTPFVAYPDEILADPTLLNLDAYLQTFFDSITVQLVDFLKKDGSRALTGSLQVDPGKGLIWQNGADYIQLIANAASNVLRIRVDSEDHTNFVDITDTGIQSHNELYSFFASGNGLAFSNALHIATLKTNLLTASHDYQLPPESGTLVTSGLVDAALALKADLVGGFVPSSQLPSYVDDVLEYEDFASLPVTGEVGKIYVLLTPYTSGGYTSSQFRWSGSTYVAIVASPGTSDAIAEGLVNLFYTAARAALNLKLDGSSAAFTGMLDFARHRGFYWEGSYDVNVRGSNEAGSKFLSGVVGEGNKNGNFNLTPDFAQLEHIDYTSGLKASAIIADALKGVGVRSKDSGFWAWFKTDNITADKTIQIPEEASPMTMATQAFVNTGLAAKLDASAYNNYYVGKYISLAALTAAKPTGLDGQYAIVDAGAGSKAQEYIWDVNEGWVLTYTNTITSTDVVTEGSSNLYFTAARVLAVLLTGLTIPAASAVLVTDNILQAIGKLQSQNNANANSITSNSTAIGTKATINGDTPAGTWRVGTTNAQSAAIRTNNTDRLTIDASGNIVQAGTTTFFDAVILRIKNTTGAFFEAMAVTVAGILKIGGGATEIQFIAPVRNWKGTNSRLVESDASGNSQAVEEIVPLQLFNATVLALLEDSTNWTGANVYGGTSLSSYGLSQGQFHNNSSFYYYMTDSVTPIRIPRYRVARRMYNLEAAVSNTGAAETTLASYTLAAKSLNKNNDSYELDLSGSFNSTSSADFKVKIGSTPDIIISKTGVSTSGYAFKIKIRIVRTNSNEQQIYAEYISNEPGSTSNLIWLYKTYTDTADIAITVTGQDTTSNKVQLRYFTVNFQPGV